MDLPTAVATGLALATGVGLGLLVHEGVHAAVLTLTGVDYDCEFHPRSGATGVPALARRPLAVVRPEPTGTEPPWTLRLAALSPLTLTIPTLVLAATGNFPTVDRPLHWAFVVGALACAVPSPQDFSVAFYAHRLLEAERTGTDDGSSPEDRT